MTAIHLVVTCSKAKARAPAPELQLRSLPDGGLPERRARAWIARLCAAAGDRLPAAELYRGDHWACVRSMAGDLLPRGGAIHICSAGYGLISCDAPLVSYAATFAPGQADSVSHPGRPLPATVRAWWQTVAEWPGPCPGEPRTLSALVQRYPDAFFLIAVSSAYLRAITPDLEEAIKYLPRPDRLALLCAGGTTSPALAPYRLPCDARLQPLVGGARTSLNVRLARRALQELPPEDWSLASLREIFATWPRQGRTQPGASHAPLSDAEVCRFIRAARAADPCACPSPLLRRLRSQGQACEQQRFVRLFRECQEIDHAPAK